MGIALLQTYSGGKVRVYDVLVNGEVVAELGNEIGFYTFDIPVFYEEFGVEQFRFVPRQASNLKEARKILNAVDWKKYFEIIEEEFGL